MKTFSTLSMRALTSLLVVASLLMSPMRLRATEQEAQDKANNVLRLLQKKGWSTRDTYKYGRLMRGQSTVVTTTLYSENDYQIVASGCNSAYDVDIEIYDENYHLIARDADTTDLAIAHFSPSWSGTFYIKIIMYNCGNDGAHWNLVYGYDKL